MSVPFAVSSDSPEGVPLGVGVVVIELVALGGTYVALGVRDSDGVVLGVLVPVGVTVVDGVSVGVAVSVWVVEGVDVGEGVPEGVLLTLAPAEPERVGVGARGRRAARGAATCRLGRPTGA